MFVANADLFSGLEFHADISIRVGSRPRLHYSQLGLKAGVFGLERIDPLGHVVPNGPGMERSMFASEKVKHTNNDFAMTVPSINVAVAIS
jgi:hypothetical protein